ncbi:MAG TPA: hypothetical protein HPP97_11285 [Desulfuromonadales bacterium]|nr:hypothetical protein [Desulfuromonadales bacterium]
MNRVFVSLILLVGATVTWAQDGVIKRRLPPFEYGRVIINNYSQQAGLPPVVFDHWLHRSKYSCRLCHLDIGFSMVANSTKIRAVDNINGVFCATCHNGKMMMNGSIIFPACAKEYTREEYKVCVRCHQLEPNVTLGKKFTSFVKNMPVEKFGNGINWEKAEREGKFKAVDHIEGVSPTRPKMKVPNDMLLKANLEGMPKVIFSHTKHAAWGGCKLCHPGLFSINKGRSVYSMDEILEGKFCGACHKTVAFPLNDCRRCHAAPVEG